MDIKGAIKQYLNALEKADYDLIIQLFSSRASVNSPLYGKVKATHFYKELFKDTSDSRITLINIFRGESPDTAAGHFRYNWVLKDGTGTSFECVDVFRFDEDGKITELTIIYDTSGIRSPFEGMKKRT